MTNNSTRQMRIVLATGVLISIAVAAHAEDALQKIRIGTAASAIQPIVTDILVPEYLGYFKAEGLSAEVIPLGSSAAALSALDSKRIEAYTTSASFVLPMAAKGETTRSVDFFEDAYPFRYQLGVLPGSSIHSFADIKGKRIGVAGFGLGDYPVGRAVLKAGGLDPDKDVSWLAVGEGVKGGIPLQRGDIDALFTFSSSFAPIEAADIKVNYIPLPNNVPKVGGFYLATSPDLLRDHKSWLIGLGRGVAKAHVFIQENPEAASYIFGLLAPEALPKGKSQQEQVKAVMVAVAKQAPFYSHYDTTIHKAGYIKTEEWQDEIAFAGLSDKLKDSSPFFTNDLIDEINRFDVEKVKAEAKAFKLPYK